MHENKLSQLNNFFKELKDKNMIVNTNFIDIHTKLNKLKDTFKDYSIDENQKLLIYCLDTLKFNNNMFYHDLNKVEELYKLLQNRIYGDLYKFYKLLNEYINRTIDDKIVISKINNEFPKYNNIDLTIHYDFDIIINIYQNIIELLEAIDEHISKKKKTNNNNKDMYKEINSYMNIYNEHVNIKSNKINMFFDYILYVSLLHIKYINGIIKRLTVIHNNINDDINNDLDTNGDGVFDFNDIQIDNNTNTKNTKNNNKNKNKNKKIKEFEESIETESV